MQRRVRGILFVDYIRMVRGKKDVDWTRYLEPADLALVGQKVVPDGWYPMETFERLGVGILHEVAFGQLEGVRMWGRFQVDAVLGAYPDLLAAGDPQGTLMRFQVLRKTFFDYDALQISGLHDGGANVTVAYGMGPIAEEAASYQSLGFFEHLVERSGGADVYARFATKSWDGADATRITLDWS